MEIKTMVKVELTEEEEDVLIQAQSIFRKICYEIDHGCSACPLQRLCNEYEMELHIVVQNALKELNK